MSDEGSNLNDAVAYPWTVFPQLPQLQPSINQILVVSNPEMGNRLDLFALCSDGALWHINQNGPNSGWTGWESLETPPGIGIANLFLVGGDTGGQIQVFVADDNSNLWTIWQDTSSPGGWSQWAEFPSPPPGVGPQLAFIQSSGTSVNVTELFTVGYNDGNFWTCWKTAGSGPTVWSNWISLGSPGPKPVISTFQVGANADGRIDVLAFASDSSLWDMWMEPVWDPMSNWKNPRNSSGPDAGFSQWVPVGSGSSGVPTLSGFQLGQPPKTYVALGPDGQGRLVLYLLDSSGMLWGRTQLLANAQNQWGDWTALPALGNLTGSQGGIAIGNDQDGRVVVFAVDNRGNAFHMWNTLAGPGGLQDSGLFDSWNGWVPIGGAPHGYLIFNGIAVGTNQDGRLELFGFGPQSSQLWHAWEPSPNNDNLVGINTTGIVLSGGGAKGDFEVGALRYLYNYGILPGILVGTSVGAINASKLAEGGTSALDQLETIWLNLQQNQDMYVPASWLNQTPAWLQGALTGALSGGGGSGLGTLAWWEVLLMSLVPGGIPLPGAPASQTQIINAILNLVNNLGNNQSLYDLSPVASLLQTSFNPSLVSQSGIKLRLAVTSLEDGEVHYITETGGDPSLPGSSVPLSTAILASSAIPGIFSPQNFFGSTFVDGGCKRIIPLDEAVSEGAYPIFVIACDPPAPPLQPANFYSTSSSNNGGAGVLNIAARAALDILTSAIEEYPIQPPPSDVTVIQPSIVVHDSMTIDPGLISISMAYGYMRSGETINYGPAGASLNSLSNQIISARLQAWNLENQAMADLAYDFIMSNQTNPPPVPGALTPTGDATLIPQLRNLKLQIRSLVCQYTQSLLFRPDLLPSTDFRSPAELATIAGRLLNGSPSPTDFRTWWMQWERHPYAPNSATPFDTFTDGTGTTVSPISTAEVAALVTTCPPPPPPPPPPKPPAPRLAGAGAGGRRGTDRKKIKGQ